MDRSEIKKGCYAVIFSSQKSENLEGYLQMEEETMRLAAETKGFTTHRFYSNITS